MIKAKSSSLQCDGASMAMSDDIKAFAGRKMVVIDKLSQTLSCSLAVFVAISSGSH